MPLSAEQIEAIKEGAERYKQHISELGRVGVSLWQTRIDMLIASGTAENVDAVIGQPQGFWDNNNCGCTVLPVE